MAFIMSVFQPAGNSHHLLVNESHVDGFLSMGRDSCTHSTSSETSFNPVNAPIEVDSSEISSKRVSTETSSKPVWVCPVWAQKRTQNQFESSFVSNVDRPSNFCWPSNFCRQIPCDHHMSQWWYGRCNNVDLLLCLSIAIRTTTVHNYKNHYSRWVATRQTFR